ncbi:flavin reductase family protein [Kitasatospora sp. NPDC056531]|uniref:flavin reductase family protein n=1 Tax=Kitasatospora sp. NPDC056531 TaxID=3345856 RepID=UPI0036B7563D
MTLPHVPDIRPFMAGFPTGVTVVTATAADGTPWGMTCSSLCSVTLDPPTLLVCLRGGSPTLAAVEAAGSFAVNLLHVHARPTAELFASGSPDRFERVVWRGGEGAAGPHLVESAHAIADCSVDEVRAMGSHAMVLGRVCAVSQLRPQQPLMYGMRRFGSFTESAEESHLLYDFMS